ncbi:MAG: arsenate reductase [Urechidicola sp.]|nr:arsenate reductase [Urechidicola sp.]
MKKIYFLKTCDTSMRILKSINIEGFELQEIKSEPITVTQLEEMKNLSSSYEALFSRRAKKYKQMDLKNQVLSEKDYRQLILDEYTFLKRPVIIINDKIFIGNSKKNVESLQKEIK